MFNSNVARGLVRKNTSVMRIRVKLLEAFGGMEKDQEKNLQPYIATRLIKQGLAVKISESTAVKSKTFVPKVEVSVDVTEIQMDNEDVEDLIRLPKDTLVEMVEAKGIEIPKKATKAILVDLLK